MGENAGFDHEKGYHHFNQLLVIASNIFKSDHMHLSNERPVHGIDPKVQGFSVYGIVFYNRIFRY